MNRFERVAGAVSSVFSLGAAALVGAKLTGINPETITGVDSFLALASSMGVAALSAAAVGVSMESRIADARLAPVPSSPEAS